MVTFAEMQLFDRLFRAVTQDGSSNPALRVVLGSLPDGANIAVGTTTGTQIGTATTQKLGFFGATPVVQPSAYTPTNVTTSRTFDADTVDAAGLADVVGTLIADLQALGLVG